MDTTIRRRTEIPCETCGRGRHRTCKACGQTKLIGYAGKPGLYDHATLELHGCNAKSDWERDGEDDGSGGNNSNSDNEKGATTGGAKGGSSSDKQDKTNPKIKGGSDTDANGEGNGQQGKQGKQQDSPLKGKLVAITGTLQGMTRAEAQAAIHKAGGGLMDNVNGHTDMLVEADKSSGDSGKSLAAGLHGVPIISEQEFMDMLNGNQQQSSDGNDGHTNSADDVTDEDLLDKLIEVLHTRREDLLGFNPDQLEKKLEDLAKEALETAKSMQTVQIEITSKTVNEDGEEETTTTTLTGGHEQMPTLIKLIGARKNIMIVGPAGSGKTRGVEEAAKAVGLSFHPKSVGPATTEYALFGYMDANGNYIPGIMRQPFEQGGVLLIDEIDAGNPSCLTALNTALANDYCSFPDGVVKKHPDFVAIASANTFGRGADRQYVGRNQMDAATLDRFIKLPWDYDRKLEQSIINGMINASGNKDLQEWLAKVWSIREAVEATKERFVCGTRAVIDGAQLILAGFSLAQTETLRIWNGTDDELRNRLLARMK